MVIEEPAQSAPVKKGPNHFVINARTKDKTHPMFGHGHTLGFYVDGQAGKEIIVRRGKTYFFDVDTGPMHDVYLSRSNVGWGSGVLTEAMGAQGNYTYNGTITFSPNSETPDIVFYQCQNHKNMGWAVFVLDEGESLSSFKNDNKEAIAQLDAGKSGKAKSAVSEQQVKQKLMYAQMLIKGDSAKRIDASKNVKAKELLAQARAQADEAAKKLAAGENDEALSLADSSLKTMSGASSMVPSEAVLKERMARYNELLEGVHNFQLSHQENYDRVLKKKGKEAAVDYDRPQVAELLKKAAQAAQSEDYTAANSILSQAQKIVTHAIHGMLDSQTITYDLNFESPADEYKYELGRYKSYEELVPIAIEEKKPAQGAVMLMDNFVKKGRSMRTDADNTAAKGDYPRAIAMIQMATEEIRRALRLAGVYQ